MSIFYCPLLFVSCNTNVRQGRISTLLPVSVLANILFLFGVCASGFCVRSRTQQEQELFSFHGNDVVGDHKYSRSEKDEAGDREETWGLFKIPGVAAVHVHLYGNKFVVCEVC